MQLHGGVGLFQSTPPTVWLSNPYINNGVVGAKQFRSTDPTKYPFSPDPYNQNSPGPVASGKGRSRGSKIRVSAPRRWRIRAASSTNSRLNERCRSDP